MKKLGAWKQMCGAAVLCALMAIAAPAQTYTTLYSFDYTAAHPEAGLILGRDGNFYGTTSEGGANRDGSVFKITPTGALTTLHNFGTTDGSVPRAVLALSTNGSLYGTTSQGGDLTCGAPNGCGTVFKITPGGTLTPLHSFAGTDGSYPYAGLIQAPDGNLYGTTSGGGAEEDYGTVFKIRPSGVLTTLHSFNRIDDGADPYAGLVQATDGSFYGTTGGGGPYSYGTVFKITSGGVLTTLHVFDSNDGAYPNGGLVQATDGNFYGTTENGGNSRNCFSGCGTIFRMNLVSLTAQTP
jgi:uncharacterized repeat protein (TIGR03803 family)